MAEKPEPASSGKDPGRSPDEPDMVYSILNLKRKILAREHICESCEKTIEDFFVFKSCHDKICHDCLESVKGINVCPACEMPFNPEDDISDRSLIEDACERMEKFVWKVLALQKATAKNAEPKDQLEDKLECLDINKDQDAETSNSSEEKHQEEKNAEAPEKKDPEDPEIESSP